MKKMIILFGVIIFLTGCSANVHINIDDNEITENIKATASNSTEYLEFKNWKGFPLPLYYNQELENPFSENREKEFGVDYYDVTFNDNERSFTATAKFDFESHKQSSMVRNCFNYYEIRKYNNSYIFSTSNGLICDYNNITLSITTPYKVTLHNATAVDESTNTYMWKITNSNKNNISVYFEIDSSKYANNDNNKQNNSNIFSDNQTIKQKSYIVYLTIGIIVIALLIIIFILKFKSKKASEV